MGDEPSSREQANLYKVVTASLIKPLFQIRGIAAVCVREREREWAYRTSGEPLLDVLFSESHVIP